MVGLSQSPSTSLAEDVDGIVVSISRYCFVLSRPQRPLQETLTAAFSLLLLPSKTALNTDGVGQEKEKGEKRAESECGIGFEVDRCECGKLAALICQKGIYSNQFFFYENICLIIFPFADFIRFA